MGGRRFGFSLPAWLELAFWSAAFRFPKVQPPIYTRRAHRLSRGQEAHATGSVIIAFSRPTGERCDEPDFPGVSRGGWRPGALRRGIPLLAPSGGSRRRSRTSAMEGKPDRR